MIIIGIDLGTSNSAAAVLRGGRPVIVPSAEGISIGGKAFPSYVALTADGQLLVGEPARRQAAANPEGTASAFKRRMGKRETIRLRDRDYSPEQLSAFLLKRAQWHRSSLAGRVALFSQVRATNRKSWPGAKQRQVGKPPPPESATVGDQLPR